MKEYKSIKSAKQAFNRIHEYQKRYISIDGRLYNVTVDVVIQDCVSGQAIVMKNDAVEEYEICPNCKKIYDDIN